MNLTTTGTFRSHVPVQVSLYWPVRHSGVVVIITDATSLCLATLESAILAIDGPKMKSSAALGFLSMLRMKMTRNTPSSWNSTNLSVVGLRDSMCYLSSPQMHLNLRYSFALSSWKTDKRNRRLSCRLRLHIVVAVGKVHRD